MEYFFFCREYIGKGTAMEKVKKGFFSCKTSEGSRRLLALFIILILVFSLCARLVSTEGGSIKVEQVTIDARGAAINGELYYPAGVSTDDSLPAVIVTHGGGCTYGVTRGIALELARRGFVVFNVSAYGTGLSEMPVSDENGMGAESYNGMETPVGLLDCLNFVRTLKFVDPGPHRHDRPFDGIKAYPVCSDNGLRLLYVQRHHDQ